MAISSFCAQTINQQIVLNDLIFELRQLVNVQLLLKYRPLAQSALPEQSQTTNPAGKSGSSTRLA
jgi:hypothetical protein